MGGGLDTQLFSAIFLFLMNKLHSHIICLTILNSKKQPDIILFSKFYLQAHNHKYFLMYTCDINDIFKLQWKHSIHRSCFLSSYLRTIILTYQNYLESPSCHFMFSQHAPLSLRWFICHPFTVLCPPQIFWMKRIYQ